MNKRLIKTITLLTLLLCGVNNLFSQEWEYFLQLNDDDEELTFNRPMVLSNGNIAISSCYFYRKSGTGRYYSTDPAVTIVSSDGEELVRKNFFREGYTTTSGGTPYLFERDGKLFALMVHNPEHDMLNPNYFLNCDNPPTDAILTLCKLDENLNILENYEHKFPIDTFENRGWINWDYLPNEYSGHVNLFGVIEDEGCIVGGFVKMVSADYDNPRGNDSTFFFRMNFDGEMLNIKGYERESHGGASVFSHTTNQIVKTDSMYIVYERGYGTKNGIIMYYDKEFNHLTTKYIMQSGYNSPVTDAEPIKDISVFKVDDNITYLSVTAACVQNPYTYNDDFDDCRLYKIDDNIENSSEYLSADNYIIRGKPETWDRALVSPIDNAPDNTLYYAYN